MKTTQNTFHDQIIHSVPCELCVLFVLWVLYVPYVQCVPCLQCVPCILCLLCVLWVLYVPCVQCVPCILCLLCVLYVICVLCIQCTSVGVSCTGCPSEEMPQPLQMIWHKKTYFFVLKLQYAGKTFFPPVVRTCSPELKRISLRCPLRGGGGGALNIHFFSPLYILVFLQNIVLNSTYLLQVYFTLYNLRLNHFGRFRRN